MHLSTEKCTTGDIKIPVYLACFHYVYELLIPLFPLNGAAKVILFFVTPKKINAKKILNLIRFLISFSYEQNTKN